MSNASNELLRFLGILVAFIVGVGVYFALVFIEGITTTIGWRLFSVNPRLSIFGIAAFFLTSVWLYKKPKRVNRLTVALWKNRFSEWDIQSDVGQQERNVAIIMHAIFGGACLVVEALFGGGIYAWLIWLALFCRYYCLFNLQKWI